MPSLGMHLSLTQHMAMTGGMTSSVFPLVERWLAADSDRQKALEYVAARKDMNRYHSVMDFLLCETVEYYHRPCLAYYAGKGKQLRATVSKAEIQRLQAILLRMISVAYIAFQEKRRLSWSAAREQALAA